MNTPSLADEQALDVVIVLDTSGSMKKNDPKQLRAQAAKMFISLLERKDRVSLVGFSNRAYPVTQLLSLEQPENEKILFKAIDQLASNGQYTNLHDAILSGYELLKKQSSNKRGQHIILMSDGKMDLGSESRNLKLLEKTLEDLTPKLAKDHIKVHTIAFTDRSYIPLLKLTAEDTHGEFILMEDANSAHKVFENLFERAKLPEMLPIYQDNFVVDRSVREITIIASKYKPDSVISLENPNGDEYNSLHPEKNIKWYRAEKFDLITIKNPDPGYWLVKYTEGGNKVYVLSDLNLEVSSTKHHAAPGAPLHIQAYLSKKGKIQTSKALLANTQFKIRAISPEGVEIENDLVDDGTEIGSERHDGIYGISYAFDLEGTYKLEVSAVGQTFDRKKSLFVNVKSFEPKRPFEQALDPVPSPPPQAESVEENSQTVSETPPATVKEPENKPDEAAKTASHTQTDTHAPADTHAQADMHNTARDADEHADKKHGSTEHHKGDHSVDNASSHSPEAIRTDIDTSSHGDQPSADDQHASNENVEESSNFTVKNAIIAFVLFNLVLAIFGGIYYFFYRRKLKQKAKDTEENEEQKVEKSSTIPGAAATDLSDNASTTISEMESDIASGLGDGNSTLSNLSDIDLEEELSSILVSESDDN